MIHGICMNTNLIYARIEKTFHQLAIYSNVVYFFRYLSMIKTTWFHYFMLIIFHPLAIIVFGNTRVVSSYVYQKSVLLIHKINILVSGFLISKYKHTFIIKIKNIHHRTKIIKEESGEREKEIWTVKWTTPS